MALFLATSLLPVALRASQEDNIKAAYLYQIVHFVEWPKLSPPSGIFKICVFGKDSIIDKLAPLHMREDDGGHIEVLFPLKLPDILSCDILYISEKKEDQLPLIFEILKNNPVVTISSIKDFIKQGGIIGFVVLNNTVRLEINLSVAIQAELLLSAKLLEIASLIVREQRGRMKIEEEPL
ncbi:MAG: YfiR family protein [Gammaproteobacteria bacterium]|nr:YfiR family protein [Gammaproteobacteria bacterium]